jgi:hypothetical protein
MAWSCSSTRAVKGGDASSTNDVGQTSDIGKSSDVAQARDVAQEVPAGALLVPPTNVMFPEAPEAACGGDALECPFPPPACADPSCDGGGCPGWAWVVYYDSPTCANSRCGYTKKYFECDVTSRCSAGGCRFNGTAAP